MPHRPSPPRFSVIVPTYNRARTIRPCIDSVLSQTCGDFELIVVDDCSSDNTVQIVEELARKDPRIRLIVHTNNRGACVARNTGIDAARAGTVAFLDSDDRWLGEKLEHSAHAIDEQTEPDWVLFSDLLILTDFGIRPSNHPTMKAGAIAEYLFAHRGSLQTSSVLLPTALAREVRFLPGLRRLQDWDFYLRLEARGARFVRLRRAVVVHDARTSGDRISNRRDHRFLNEWIQERRHLISSTAYAGFLANKVAPEAAAEGRRVLAAQLLAYGLWHRAVPPRNALIESLRIALPDAGFDSLRVMRNSLARLTRTKAWTTAHPSGPDTSRDQGPGR